MGGHAFNRTNPAQRLTTPELLSLAKYIRTCLSDTFLAMQHLDFLADKATHGDLDMLCAWEAPSWAVEDKAPEEEKAALAEGIAKQVGATRWRTSGSRVGSLEIHLAVPCSIFDHDENSSKEGDGYWQVDLLMCLPHHYQFRHFIGSYSLTSVILGHGVKSISGRLFLQEEKLTLKHSAIEEVTEIVLVLSEDVVGVCDWLGVDYTRWRRGFANEDEYWNWAINVKPKSKLWYEYFRLARRHQAGYVPPKEGRPRVEEMKRFYAWLQTTRFAPGPSALDEGVAAVERQSSVTGKADPSEGFSTPGATQKGGVDKDIPIDNANLILPPNGMTDTADSSHDTSTLNIPQPDRVKFRPRYRDFAPEPAIPLGTLISTVDRIADLEAEMIKPARWDLDRGALGALNFWGMRTRYFELVEDRREMKRVILRGQLRKARAKEWRQKGWGQWIGEIVQRWAGWANWAGGVVGVGKA